MPRYEYKVLPAPKRGLKAKGIKAGDERYAMALTETINTEAQQGWEYFRAESLPVTEKPGILSRPVTREQHLLVFRRERAATNVQPETTISGADPTAFPTTTSPLRRDRPVVVTENAAVPLRRDPPEDLRREHADGGPVFSRNSRPEPVDGDTE